MSDVVRRNRFHMVVLRDIAEDSHILDAMPKQHRNEGAVFQFLKEWNAGTAGGESPFYITVTSPPLVTDKRALGDDGVYTMVLALDAVEAYPTAHAVYLVQKIWERGVIAGRFQILD